MSDMRVGSERTARAAGWLYILAAYASSLTVVALAVTDGSNLAMAGFSLLTIGCVLLGRSLIRKGRA